MIINHPEGLERAAMGDGLEREGVESSWDRTDWQSLWLHTQSLDWKMLTLVPGDEQVSTLAVANLIAKLAQDHSEAIQVVDMRDRGLKHVGALMDAARRETTRGARFVFATRSVSANLATVHVARSSDCAILCASLGSTSIAAVRETVERVGRKHFLGSLLVRASAETARRPPRLTWPAVPKAGL